MNRLRPLALFAALPLAAFGALGPDAISERLKEIEAYPAPNGWPLLCTTGAPVTVYEDYICPACGERTRWAAPANLTPSAILQRMEATAAQLRPQGLEVAVDPSPLCARCAGLPCEASLPDEAVVNATGERVRVTGHYRDVYITGRLAEGKAWISRRYVDASGAVTARRVNVRSAPSLDGDVLDMVDKGFKVEPLPASPEDPPEWLPIRFGGELVRKFPHGLLTLVSRVAGIAPKAGEAPAPAWIVQGVRTPYRPDDEALLLAFAKGARWVRLPIGMAEQPLKVHLPRLRTLLGADTARVIQ